MHEVSVAEDIFFSIEKYLGRKAELENVSVTIGILSGIEPDALKFCFPEVASYMGFGTPELIVNEVKAKIKCLSCGTIYETDDLNSFCPECVSMQREILTGREFKIDYVTIKEEKNV